MMEEETVIMSALSTLSPTQFSDLTRSINSTTHHHFHRLSSLLSSPSIFCLTLRRLRSLTLQDKSLIIARHLLSSLHHLTCHFHLSPPPARHANHRDLDTALLLLLLCHVYQQTPEALRAAPLNQWQRVLRNVFYDTMISISGVGGVLIPFIEMVTRSWRFLGKMGCHRGAGKGGIEVAASPAVVVALPRVEIREGKVVECVICREEMKEGRDVCELPCGHLFHWICILPWLNKRNSCPCCRFQLPTDDVFVETQRLWSVLVKLGGGRVG